MATLKTNKLNLIGQTFGRWAVQEIIDNSWCRCKCSCGSIKKVWINNLTRNLTLSCGCLRMEGQIKHGQAHTHEFRVWQQMRMRCEKPDDKGYKNYGARGIYVCERWRKDFGNFYSDMGPRPKGGRYTIERKDNDGPYSPENCIWALYIVQANNRRGNRFLTYNGMRKTVSQWARHLNMSKPVLNSRLQYGWTVEDALTRPVIHRAKRLLHR